MDEILSCEELTLKVNSLEKEVKFNNFFLKKMFDIMPSPMFYKNKNGVYEHCNDTFSRLILGIPKEEILGKTTLELNIWKNKEIREEFVKNKEILENIELEVSKKNGENLMCLISSNIIKMMGEDHIVSVLRDITERKELEIKLEENEDFLSDIIENNPALIYAKNVEGKYKLVNRTWENLIGMESENVIGKTDLELFGKDVAENVAKADNIVLNGESALGKEEILKDSNETRYFLSNKFPIRNKDKVINGICGISLEITEQKNQKKELKIY